MPARAHTRGHPVFFDEEAQVWRYEDDGALMAGWGGEERPCTFCGETADPLGPDPCLGWLPGVQSACCGHGLKPPSIVKADYASQEKGKP